MHRISFVQFACVTAALGPLLANSPARASDNGSTFKVHVTTSSGDQFDDCFAYVDGHLFVSGYGQLNYTSRGLNGSRTYFQGLSPLSSATEAGFTIQFIGSADNKGAIKGEGSDEFGVTYVFAGKFDPSCVSVFHQGASPYGHPTR